MVEIQGEHAVRQLQPFGAVAAVNVVPHGQKPSVDRAVRPLEEYDRAVEQALDLLIRVLLGVVIELRPRRIDRLFDDDLPVEIGQHLPPPRLEDHPDAEEVPALLGFSLCVHVDEVLAERPVHVAPLLRAVITPRVVTHFPPALSGAEIRRRRVPLLGVVPDKSAVELR